MSWLRRNEVWIYIICAYLISVALRLIYIYQVGGNPSYYWNGELMLNTNDGYFWASGVKNLFDHSLEHNYRVPGLEYGVVAFTYLIAKILPFSLDTITFYMPIFISSLIVIPIVLIMKLYDRAFLGFLAGILAAIAWSFYNRTMAGYYDSDFFAIVFPVFILYFFIKFLRQRDFTTLLVALLLNSLYFYAYDASKSVIYAMGIGFILYATLFLRKEEHFFDYIFLVSLSMLDIHWALRILLVLAAWFVVTRGVIKEKRVSIALAVLAFIAFLFFGQVFHIIWTKIYAYIHTGVDESVGLKFYEVHQTISEANAIPFTIFADRISGSVIGFFVALIGYIYLAWRKREFLLFLPLIAIGFFAYKGGLRFTVYAIPALAMGAVYLFWEIAKLFDPKNRKLHFTLTTVAAALLIAPNIYHILDYNRHIQPVFLKSEVKDLDRLKKIASNKDYTLTWWDYGYPIWYYSETNTLIDGGKHQNDNYIISKIMQSDSPLLMANFSRLAVEKYVAAIKSYKNYKEHDEEEKYIPKEFKLYNKDEVYHAVGDGNGAIVDALFEGGAKELKDPQELLERLKSSDYQPPKKSRDIYIYMPNKMTRIFATVMVFGNIDLLTGDRLRDSIYYSSYVRRVKKDGKIELSNGLVFDQKKGLLYFGQRSFEVKNFFVTQNLKNGDIKVLPKIYHKEGGFVVIYMKSYRKLLVMDSDTFRANYIQMGILGNYDKDLFELVVKSPYGRIYKIKR